VYCQALNETSAVSYPHEDKSFQHSAMVRSQEPNMTSRSQSISERFFIEMPFASESRLVKTKDVLNH
jgi:hypothetical protein